MDGGDLRTIHRGGDLKTSSRQDGGFLFKLLGLGDLKSQMSDPAKQQLLMQRGGFPWALAGLSLLPALLGKGEGEVIKAQMQAVHEPTTQRGGVGGPWQHYFAKSLPILKTVGAPLALGALASVGDNVVDKVFGKGKMKTKRLTSRKRRPLKRARHRRHTSGFKKLLGKKAKQALKKNLRKAGRRLFEQGAARFERRTTPFASRLRESIERASTPNSSHIGQSFNI